MKKYTYIEGLVSIIIPCYNVENCIENMFQSIMEQSYPDYEIIVVNDASADETEQVLLRYKEIFNSRGIDFTYLCHEKNKDISGALNTGLQYAKGEFLIWPDADDILLEDSIKSRVELLQRHTEYGFASGQVIQIDKEENIIVKHHNVVEEDFTDRYFDGIFLEKKYIMAAQSSCMIRLKEFDKYVNNRKLFETRLGQNIQMLFPIAYFTRCGFVHKDVYKYISSKAGHYGRSSGTFELDIKKVDLFKECVINTIMPLEMENSVKETLLQVINKEMAIRKLRLYSVYRCWESYKEEVLALTREIVEPSELMALAVERKVWIWGANEYGMIWEYVFKENGIKNIGFIDSDLNNGAYTIEELDINKEKDFIFVSMRRYYEDVINKIDSKGFYRNADYMYPYEDIIKWREYAGI